MSKPKVTKPLTKVVKALSLCPLLLGDIDRMAADENRSLSNMVETLLKAEVAKRKKSITP